MSTLKSIDNGSFWGGTSMFEFEAPSVGDTFKIRVALPPSYQSGERDYPVLYVLDSDGSFGLAVSTMMYMNLGANFGMGMGIPEMIVVGIGYERGVIPWLFTRVRDFTPTQDATFNYNNPGFNIPESGKAATFLQCLRSEIMPALEARYRIDSTQKVVASHSMSALFALYDMFQPERSFQKYILSCPFAEWDSEALFQIEAAYAQANSALPVEAFFTVTPNEPTPTYAESLQRFIQILQQRAYDNFTLNAVTYEQDNHFSVWPKAFIDGLVSVFNA